MQFGTQNGKSENKGLMQEVTFEQLCTKIYLQC